MLAQILVGLAEMMIAKEATVSREWGGMRRSEHKMLRAVNQLALTDCI